MQENLHIPETAALDSFSVASFFITRHSPKRRFVRVSQVASPSASLLMVGITWLRFGTSMDSTRMLLARESFIMVSMVPELFQSAAIPSNRLPKSALRFVYKTETDSPIWWFLDAVDFKSYQKSNFSSIFKGLPRSEQTTRRTRSQKALTIMPLACFCAARNLVGFELHGEIPKTIGNYGLLRHRPPEREEARDLRHSCRWAT